MESLIFVSILVLGFFTTMFYIIIEEKIKELEKRLNKRQICDYINVPKNEVMIRDANCQKHTHHAHIARTSNGEEIIVIDIDID
jgi:hypothetical protein